jgi:HEAT repeat protein
MANFADPEKDTADVKAAARFLMTNAFKAGEGQIKNFSVFAAGDLAGRLNPNSPTREKLVKHLREAVEKKDTYLRACAAVACGVAQDTNARDIIIGVLRKSNDTHVLAAMCMGLGLLRDTRRDSVDLIRDRVMLQSKWGADNRGGAAMGLALTGDTTRIEELEKFHVNNRDRLTKRHTPLAIGVLGGKTEAKALVRMFESPFDQKDIYPVSNAVYGLSWIRDQDAVAKLVELAGNDSKKVRGMAIIALGRVGARHRVDPLTRCFENMSHNNRFRWGILYAISRIL